MIIAIGPSVYFATNKLNRLTRSDSTLSRSLSAKDLAGQSEKAHFAKSVSYLIAFFERLAFDCRVPMQSHLLAATVLAALHAISKGPAAVRGPMTCLKQQLGRGFQSRVLLHVQLPPPCFGPFSCQCMMPWSEGGSGGSQVGGVPIRLQAATMRHLPDTTSANVGPAVPPHEQFGHASGPFLHSRFSPHTS